MIPELANIRRQFGIEMNVEPTERAEHRVPPIHHDEVVSGVIVDGQRLGELLACQYRRAFERFVFRLRHVRECVTVYTAGRGDLLASAGHAGSDECAK